MTNAGIAGSARLRPVVWTPGGSIGQAGNEQEIADSQEMTNDRFVLSPRQSPFTTHLTGMRIISGSARGIPLRIPSHDVRPTMEMVRGAIFSALGERVMEARVLDLFSGSGAFGIEALSRGAAVATFVDDHPKAIAAIKANLEKTRLEATIVRSDVFRFLERTDQKFDLIFADPPYSKQPNDPDLAAKLIASSALKNRLVDDGLLVLEKTSGGLPVEAHGWMTIRDKTYGSTQVLFLSANTKPQPQMNAD